MGTNIGVVRKFADEVMGRQVRFTRYFQRCCRRQGERRLYTWDTLNFPQPQVGWAVGLRWLQQGFRVPGGYDEQGYLKETGPRVLCALVAAWPTNKPNKVPLDDIELLDEPQKLYSWCTDERELLRTQCKSFPRGEDGRFLSDPPYPIKRGPGTAWSLYEPESKEGSGRDINTSPPENRKA